MTALERFMNTNTISFNHSAESNLLYMISLFEIEMDEGVGDRFDTHKILIENFEIKS